jgi:CRP/FNR family transcriptional regulator, cyclic AMP receptor protein
MADDLDFSKPAGAPKPAAPAAPQAPIYVPAIAKAFFESAGKEEQAAAGTVFFSENQKGGLFSKSKMYYLAEGQVGLFSGGKPVGTIRSGQIFGEMAAITDASRSATAAAQTPCRVISLDDKAFKTALQNKPEFALMMLGMLIQRLRGMMTKISGIPSAQDVKESPRVFDKALLASLSQGLGDPSQQRYNKGQVIMVAGQTGALMYVVLEGKVSISIRGAVVQFVGPGAVFGEMALIDQSPRSANAAAETDCVLLGINRQVFLNLIKSNPTFGSSLLTAVAERVRNTAAGIN